MKKSLLLASMCALGLSANALTSDGQTYEPKDGNVLTSKWVACLNTNSAAWNGDYTDLAASTGARTAVVGKVNGEDKILITQTNADEDVTGSLYIIDLFTGKLEKKVQLSHDGVPFTGTLCVNQVGCDDFGHVWVCGATFSPYITPADGGEGHSNPITVYQVVNFETGECTKAFSTELPESEKDASGRLDYYDVAGDITREKAACVFMTAVSGGSGESQMAPFVYGWRAEAGSDEFLPLLSDGEYVSMPMEETYPAGQTTWGTAPTVNIIRDEDFTGEMYYTDGFTTCPTLYNTSGSMLSSFAPVVDLAPKVGTNGVCEFTLNNWPYLFYSIEQYDVSPGCRARICKLGEGSNFEEMQELWTIPANGLGELSDGGARYHAVNARIFTDENNVEGAYILTYKCKNGMGVYTMAPEAWVDPNNGVEGIIADDNNNAPVEYFNLNGVAVSADNLTPGLYITRQGAKASKVVIK